MSKDDVVPLERFNWDGLKTQGTGFVYGPGGDKFKVWKFDDCAQIEITEATSQFAFKDDEKMGTTSQLTFNLDTATYDAKTKVYSGKDPVTKYTCHADNFLRKHIADHVQTFLPDFVNPEDEPGVTKARIRDKCMAILDKKPKANKKAGTKLKSGAVVPAFYPKSIAIDISKNRRRELQWIVLGDDGKETSPYSLGDRQALKSMWIQPMGIRAEKDPQGNYGGFKFVGEITQVTLSGAGSMDGEIQERTSRNRKRLGLEETSSFKPVVAKGKADASAAADNKGGGLAATNAGDGADDAEADEGGGGDGATTSSAEGTGGRPSGFSTIDTSAPAAKKHKR